jgi:hypothetical protein
VIILPEPDTLSKVDIKKVLDFSSTLGSWLKAVDAYAFSMLERGEPIEGYKLVKKRANRKWKGGSECDIAADLSNIFMLNDSKVFWNAPKLKSPAQIEPMKFDKNLVASLCEIPDSGNTMVPIYDKRPEVLPSLQTDFSVIEFSE